MRARPARTRMGWRAGWRLRTTARRAASARASSSRTLASSSTRCVFMAFVLLAGWPQGFGRWHSVLGQYLGPEGARLFCPRILGHSALAGQGRLSRDAHGAASGATPVGAPATAGTMDCALAIRRRRIVLA